jgi:hypothetical protein
MGPSKDYGLLGQFTSSSLELPIEGRSEDSEWYLVLLPDGQLGWIHKSNVTVGGNWYSVPIVIAPTFTPVPTDTPSPTSTATPTNTLTVTHTPTATSTVTHTLTMTPTNTITPTLTETPTLTTTPTPTMTNTVTETPTLTPTPTQEPVPGCLLEIEDTYVQKGVITIDQYSQGEKGLCPPAGVPSLSATDYTYDEMLLFCERLQHSRLKFHVVTWQEWNAAQPQFEERDDILTEWIHENGEWKFVRLDTKELLIPDNPAALKRGFRCAAQKSP